MAETRPYEVVIVQVIVDQDATVKLKSYCLLTARQEY